MVAMLFSAGSWQHGRAGEPGATEPSCWQNKTPWFCCMANAQRLFTSTCRKKISRGNTSKDKNQKSTLGGTHLCIQQGSLKKTTRPSRQPPTPAHRCILVTRSPSPVCPASDPAKWKTMRGFCGACFMRAFPLLFQAQPNTQACSAKPHPPTMTLIGEKSVRSVLASDCSVAVAPT